MRNSSFSFVLIRLKHYRCFRHGPKKCMWFRYKISNYFCYFLQAESRHFQAFYDQIEYIIDTLREQLVHIIYYGGIKYIHLCKFDYFSHR